MSASLPSEAGFLVVTGTRRGGLPRTTRVAIEVDDAPPGDGGEPDDDGGGCQAARSGSGRVPGTVASLLAALVFLARRPRRRPQHHAGARA